MSAAAAEPADGAQTEQIGSPVAMAAAAAAAAAEDGPEPPRRSRQRASARQAAVTMAMAIDDSFWDDAEVQDDVELSFSAQSAANPKKRPAAAKAKASGKRPRKSATPAESTSPKPQPPAASRKRKSKGGGSTPSLSSATAPSSATPSSDLPSAPVPMDAAGADDQPPAPISKTAAKRAGGGKGSAKAPPKPAAASAASSAAKGKQRKPGASTAAKKKASSVDEPDEADESDADAAKDPATKGTKPKNQRRRNIKAIESDNELDEATQRARALEQKRLARIQARAGSGKPSASPSSAVKGSAAAHRGGKGKAKKAVAKGQSKAQVSADWDGAEADEEDEDEGELEGGQPRGKRPAASRQRRRVAADDDFDDDDFDDEMVDAAVSAVSIASAARTGRRAAAVAASAKAAMAAASEKALDKFLFSPASPDRGAKAKAPAAAKSAPKPQPKRAQNAKPPREDKVDLSGLNEAELADMRLAAAVAAAAEEDEAMWGDGQHDIYGLSDDSFEQDSDADLMSEDDIDQEVEWHNLHMDMLLKQSAGDGSEGVLTSSDDDSSESGLEDELAELAEKRVAQSRAGAGEGDDMPAAKDAEDKDKGEHAETEQSQQPALEQDAEEMRLRGGGQAKPQSMEDEAAGAGAAAMEVGDDEAGKADAPKTGQKKVEDSSSGGEKRSRRPVINLHAPDNEAIIKVPRELRSKLAPHQINGIRFLWDNLVEDIKTYEETKNEGMGCILAHAMGLGKTLQSICFIHLFLRHTSARKVMIIVPVNTLLNWRREFMRWLTPRHQPKVFLLAGKHSKGKLRDQVVLKWAELGGVLLVGYEQLRLLIGGSKDKDGEVYRAVCNPGPDLVVCDEGHRIKNSGSGISKALKQIASGRRLCLTGTPLQNSLEEYWCMVDFVRPNYLGTLRQFSNRFIAPITNGQCSDSTDKDVKLMRFRSHVLIEMLKGFVDRQSHSVVAAALPARHEYVLFTRLTPIQEKMYAEFLALGKSQGLLDAYATLAKVCNSPVVLMKEAAQSKNSGDRTSEGSRPSSGLGLSDAGDGDEPPAAAVDAGWVAKVLGDDYRPGKNMDSAKIDMLLQILRHSLEANDRIIVCSQFISTLDLIEEVLQKTGVPGVNIKWRPNKTYFRLDGGVSFKQRDRMIRAFSRKVGRIFLLSTKAGGIGVNLVAANRLVLYDTSWNPSNDEQALCRVYRYGQTKPVFVYRLVAAGTIEQKVFDRQTQKSSLALRVVDDRSQRRAFESTEFDNYLAFSPPPPLDVDKLHNCIPVKQDTVLQGIVAGGDVSIFADAPDVRDTMLGENKDEILTSEEKAAALEEYEQETARGQAKRAGPRGRPPGASSSARPSSSSDAASGRQPPRPKQQSAQISELPDLPDGSLQRDSEGGWAEPQSVCSFCGLPNASFTCPLCLNQPYCDRSCQLRGWLAHRLDCRGSQKLCTVCGKAASVLCPVCLVQPYCSRSCQVTDWQLHSQYCIPKQGREEQMAAAVATASASVPASASASASASAASMGAQRAVAADPVIGGFGGAEGGFHSQGMEAASSRSREQQAAAAVANRAMCHGCGQPADLMCPLCRTQSYCSIECQHMVGSACVCLSHPHITSHPKTNPPSLPPSSGLGTGQHAAASLNSSIVIL